MPESPAPLFTPEQIAAGRTSDDATVAAWAASKAVIALVDGDFDDALTATEQAGHAARDRLLDRIAREDRRELAPRIREFADPAQPCGVAVRTLLALEDEHAVSIAKQWLERRAAEDADDVGLVVHALVARGTPEALAVAREERDARRFGVQAPMGLAFTLLAATADDDDASAAITAWLQAPPSEWGGEDHVCAMVAECGLAAVPASWFGAKRRVPEFFDIVAKTTDARLDATFPAEERKELQRHWQKRHWQEVAARIRKATDDERLAPALRALVVAIRSHVDGFSRLAVDDAGDLLAVLVGAALLSQAETVDAATLDLEALVVEMGRDVRRIDPRATRALIERTVALGDASIDALSGLVVTHAGRPGGGLAIAALLRHEGPARLRGLYRAADTPLPQTLISGVLDGLQGAGVHGLPLLREAMQSPPDSPTPGVAALIQGAPFEETVDLFLQVLPRWLARSKQRTLALCAVLGSARLIPPLEEDWVEGEITVAQIIRLLATLAGDTATAEKYPAEPPARPSMLRGADGQPMMPPMRLLLRCVDCAHGYYYEVRQVRITDPNARFVEEDGPPGPPEGINVDEPITCKRCGAIDQYRFTIEAVQSVRDAMQAEMMLAMEQQMRAQQQAAMGSPGGVPGQPPPPGTGGNEPPPRLSPGGIILP